MTCVFFMGVILTRPWLRQGWATQTTLMPPMRRSRPAAEMILS